MRGTDRDAAFSEFVAARQAHLRRIAYALCGDWHKADDLLQTSLTKLYVAWPRHPAAGRRGGLLPADHGARQHRRVPAAVASRAAHATTCPTTAHPEPTPVEERSALFDALQALPEQQRKVVVLRHWLGLSVRETATELGINEGTVKSHSSRGLAALEAVLAPHR